MGWKIACLAVHMATAAATAGNGEMTTELLTQGLDKPVFVTAPPGDTERLFVIERDGRIRIVDLETGLLHAFPFLDITTEINQFGSGMLGLTFDPNYAENGHVYVHYSGGPGATQATIVVSRFTVWPDNPDQVDHTSEHVIMSFDAPWIAHRGGWLAFGPDGYLYAAFGDGGDPCNATELNGPHQLGRIVRVDVAGDDFPGDPLRNYAIPPDNPFVGGQINDETWVYGLRQPWGVSFDRETGDLYIADVGEIDREELNILPAGESGLDYGWPCREGTIEGIASCFPDGLCDESGTVPPVHEYPHPGGFVPAAIIGGAVYRGDGIPGLQGTYFFADLYGTFWTARFEGGVLTEFTDRTSELDPSGDLSLDYVASISEGASGELFVIEFLQGAVYKIVRNSCPQDVNLDEVVDVRDMVIILLNWGLPTEEADINGDGIVGNMDLLTVLTGWGPCP